MTYSKKFYELDNPNSYNSNRYGVCPSYAKMVGHGSKKICFYDIYLRAYLTDQNPIIKQALANNNNMNNSQ
jgi:hypothetical protein